MKFSLFKDILDQSKKYAEYMSMHFLGEPLLNPELSKMIECAKNAGIKTVISTNATMLNKKKAEEIINSGLDLIVFSLDSVSDSTYEKIRRGGNYKVTLENIKSFLELKKKLAKNFPKTVVQLVEVSHNKNEARKFYEEWRTVQVDSAMLRESHTWAGEVDSATTLSNSLNNELIDQPCFDIWTKSVITWDGKVVPCCKDVDNKYVIGDVTKDQIKDIWNSEKMRYLRKKHVLGEYKEVPLCEKCIPPKGNSTLYHLFRSPLHISKDYFHVEHRKWEDI